MKILHVVGSLDRGGAETWLAQMLHHIDRHQYSMDFLVHTTEPGALDKQIKELGARIIPCLPRLHSGNPLRYARNFRRILRECGPYDCVHSHIHHSSGYTLMLAAMMGVPVRIAHSHNDTCAVDRTYPSARRIYSSGMDVLIRHFATVGIAVSRSAAPSLFSDAWTADPRWRLCPLGIDLRPFTMAIDSHTIRAGLGIAQNSFVIGHVGRFAEQKNHRFLVDIAGYLSKTEPTAVFLLVGDGPLKSEIEAMVRARGLSTKFIFLGVRGDVQRLMLGAMDCFLFPSSHEGLGLVLWEAQAAGLTCVISDTIPEEASVVTRLVCRLSLDAAPEVWASELQRIRPIAGRSRDPLPAKFSNYTIEASAAGLTRIYDSCMRNIYAGNRRAVVRT
jgi:glycosyltransferase involved in cell wall biosynthesis